MIKLFDVQNGQVIPTEHCYTLRSLKTIMEEYPQDYLKVYQYIFYMTCPNPDLNPFFHTPAHEKEELILDELQPEFSTEDDAIVAAVERCRKLFETETSRMYDGIKQALDNIATYLKMTAITDGKEGNIAQIRAMAKDFNDIRASYKGVFKDLQEEQKSVVRGGKNLAYDQ